MGPHMGYHAGGGMMGGGMRAGPGVTMGWSMMTPQERQAHQSKMAGFKTYAECHAYVLEHHKLMAERARAQGMTIPAEPRRDACAGLPR
ncbi:MAG: hypothetical protein KGO51_05615 [Alphaproteobacteria bacterium]|nr:hypothetical protein [Alphaproteobacteria bacterium]